MALRFIDPMPSVLGAEEGWREHVKRLSGIRDHEPPSWAHKPGQRWEQGSGWAAALQSWSQGEGWTPTQPRMIDLSLPRSTDPG